MATVRPVRGDLIEVDRGLFQHWGVYVGYGDVVHFGTIGEVSFSASMADVDGEVRQDRLTDVVMDDEWRINNTKHLGVRPRAPHQIVAAALAEVGTQMRYNLANNNCEHFATRMRYGRAMSMQVRRTAAAAGSALVVMSAVSPAAGVATLASVVTMASQCTLRN